MAQTYTTQFFDVSDGDTTTHNPQELAPTTAAIRVLDADIQWEGVTTSSTSTSTRSNTNSDTATATTSTNRTTSSNTNSDSATASVVTDTQIETTIATGDDNAEAFVPSGPANSTLQSVDVQYEAKRKFAGSSTETIVYNTADGNNGVQQELDSFYSTVDNVINDTTPRDSYAVGKTTFGNETKFRATIEATFEVERIVSETASVDHPSVPNGFSLDRYVLREYENGNRVKKQTFFSNLASQTRTSTDPATTVEDASTGNWGALDVVPLTNEDAIDQFAFYDSDVGWLAPREQSTTPI